MASKKKLKRKIKKLKAQIVQMEDSLHYWKNQPRKTIYVMPGESLADAVNIPIAEETIINVSNNNQTV